VFVKVALRRPEKEEESMMRLDVPRKTNPSPSIRGEDEEETKQDFILMDVEEAWELMMEGMLMLEEVMLVKLQVRR
jgi:hypothetical protein